MNAKKSFQIYYLLLVEGATEFNLFAYLTKVKFKSDFAKSNIQFSNKITITDIDVSRGNLNGAGTLSSFRKKYNRIKKDDRYKGEKLFFVLDKDLGDSAAIGKLIKQKGDIVQFVEYNFEYLLLKLGGKNPKKLSNFTDLGSFRTYCKEEFKKQFKKEPSGFKKDSDFNSIFNNVKDTEIRRNFSELFSTISS